MKFAYQDNSKINEKLFWDEEIIKVDIYPITDEEYNDYLKSMEEYVADEDLVWNLWKNYKQCKRLVKNKVKENRKLIIHKMKLNKIYDETPITKCLEAYKKWQMAEAKSVAKWENNRWFGKNSEVIIGEEDNCEFASVEEAYEKYYEIQKANINRSRAVDEENLRMAKFYNGL